MIKLSEKQGKLSFTIGGIEDYFLFNFQIIGTEARVYVGTRVISGLFSEFTNEADTPYPSIEALEEILVKYAVNGFQEAGSGLTDAQLRATAVPVSLNISTLATKAEQALLLTELKLKADLTETQPVSVASLPLPSGASTSALQTEISTKLSSIIATYGGLFRLEQAAATGLIEGLTNASFLGLNATTGAVNETCCDFSGVLVPLTANTQLYASSSSASDVGQIIIVNGVTADYMPVTRTVTLNGQNQAPLSGLIFFADDATSLNGTGLVGTVYIATASALTAGVPTALNAIKSQINLDTNFNPDKSNGTTRNGFKVVPAGKTMLITRLKPVSGKNDDAFFTFGIKLFGTQEIFPSSLNVYQSLSNIDVAFALPEKSVLQVYTRASTGSIQTVCGVDAVFLDNVIFGL